MTASARRRATWWCDVRRRSRSWRVRRCDDSGTLVVELVVLTPVVLVLAVSSLVFGRVSEARQQVVEAARAGAEAAAILPTAGTAQWVGSMNAVTDLIGRTHTCAHVTISVDTGQFVPGGTVTVHVACQVLLSDLAFPGVPGSTLVQASATAPLDPYRSVG
jgi:Flp pilus assembly protein TadG